MGWEDYHPDRVAAMPKGFGGLASQKVMKIQEAYEIIRAALMGGPP